MKFSVMSIPSTSKFRRSSTMTRAGMNSHFLRPSSIHLTRRRRSLNILRPVAYLFAKIEGGCIFLDPKVRGIIIS